MGISPRTRDRDPLVTMRRILSVVTAVGETVPQRVVDWIVVAIDHDDGDVRKVRAFALKACSGAIDDPNRVSPHDAVKVIRDIIVRRLASVEV